ncbi:MAG: c-type cytochrome domain-containing protein [Woeseiaceae bacterium]|nr:c-type cytochrome domain-containing protein [Woeseiaceae bacterium]
MRNFNYLATIAAGIGLAACTSEPEPPAAVSFAADVKPILEARCIGCHDIAAEGVAASGLNLADHAGVMAGTKFGPVVVPGNSDSSTLYLVVARKTDPEIHMPPHHRDALAEGRGEPLTGAEIDTLKTWIDQGALDN